MSGVPVGGQMQPALDPGPAKTGEIDVETVDDAQVVLHRRENGVQWEPAGLGDGPVPEGVEVLGLDGGRGVVPQLVQRQVKERHGAYAPVP